MDCLDSLNCFCMVGCGSSNSSDHISHNQIFIVIAIIIVLKYMSLSSLPVECGGCPSLPVRRCIKCKYYYAIVIIYLNCRPIVLLIIASVIHFGVYHTHIAKGMPNTLSTFTYPRVLDRPFILILACISLFLLW